MTTETTDTPPAPAAERRSWLRDHSELGVCVLLLALGVLVLTDTLTMDVDIAQRGPVGPKTVPIVVGAGLLLIAALLAVDVLRGGTGVPREARLAGVVVGRRAGQAGTDEDIDLSEPADWRTVLLLAGVFLGAAVLIEPLGFPIAGALLFWGAAFVLGSRRPDRDPLIAAVISLVTYAVFNNLLGVPLPGGPLMGVL
ncbi:tripartite tricarboxylate transporter TctB family protein [Streptomyces sp. DSM 40750]|uniref:tripartite tricarboxylate transporter TctB family protein n=1 Tax=Streptomyces sp. DSM 40750 TaxID=2801030 RepID=UPI00214A8E14|nr:tripartite tricarboxylate transporter TctB family protein [Streptomyces sp. DSM 40750]UUU26798.1 tripartite tricarboxylate transporter TctB family protein [Streptomyces sp. DSM 40750]